MGNVKYATVFWEKENTYSAVKTSKIRPKNEVAFSHTESLNENWSIEYEKGQFDVGLVIAVGSRAKMEKLAADRAEEISNISMQEKEEDDEYTAMSKKSRKNAAKRKIDDICLDTESPRFSVKKHKLEQKAKNVERHTLSVIEKMKQETHVNNAELSDEIINEVILESSFLASLSEMNASYVEVRTSDSETFDDNSMHENILNGDENVEEGETDEPFGNQNSLETFNSFEVAKSDKEILLEESVKSLKAKLRKAKKEKRHLEKQLNELQATRQVPDQPVDIENGILISEIILKEIKSDFRYNPSKFLRAMMYSTKLFTYEEVALSSLTGQKSRDGQRPRLDFMKFSTVTDYTIKKCKLQPRSLPYEKFKRAMRDVCTDARKHLKGSKKNQDLNV